MNKLMALLTLILVFSSANVQTKNFRDQPFLETTSKVDTLVTPDRIYLSLLISESDTKGKQSVEELEWEMADKLKEIGIDLERQLTLTDLSSNFKKYVLRKQDILKAKSFELLVFDARAAGQVIYALEGIGISNVDLERTEFSGIEELKLELKSKAVEKARKQADAMVRPLNQTVGKAIFISDIKTGMINVLEGKVAGIRIRGSSSMEQEYVAIPIEFEKIEVETVVNVKYILN